MKKLLMAVCTSAVLVGSAVAGPLTQGLEINGGENSFAALTLKRAQNVKEESGEVKLRVSLNEAQQLKGYGFVLHFDPTKYEFLSAKEVDGNLLNASGGESTLFLASDKTPGQIAVGSMKVDGQGATGNGELVEFTFRTQDPPIPTDFQILDGVLVDLAGSIDAINHIEIGSLVPVPTDYSLDQNLPNPFNPSTTIKYQLPSSGDVSMIVYNLLGQQVRNLVKETMDAGFHSVVWDGKDELGKQVASGVYIYRIQSGDFSTAKRMMLLK
ncbi:MAG: hypothetical protein ACI8V2_003201 [Candidatus Latescibacterota bacterium]|jgi:hypothetical protein